MPKPVFNQERCKACELCVAVCPKKILFLETHFNTKGYNPAAVRDAEKCVGCAACAKMCPDVVIEIEK